MEKSFSTIEELQAEIGILQLKREEQEIAIHEKFNGPVAILKTIGSLFRGDSASGKKNFFDDLLSEDIISNISRVLLPLILNNSLFRGSNFITKTLVTLFSQKAAKNVNMDFLTAAIDKIKTLFDKKGKSTGKQSAEDYGIPPDSETY